MIVDRRIDRNAFQEYLRKDTPIMWSVKQGRPITHYIWRTRQDGKMRSAYAEREGQILSWDDPPEGGQPGEDDDRRFSTKPFFPEVSEYIELSTGAIGTKLGWSDNDFPKPLIQWSRARNYAHENRTS